MRGIRDPSGDPEQYRSDIMGRRADGRMITKSELIEQISLKQSHLPMKDVEHAVKNILEYLGRSLSKGKRIEIRGFGSFSLRHRKARVARNPKTGTPVPMASKNIPYFKPGKLLRDRIRNTALVSQQQSYSE